MAELLLSASGIEVWHGNSLDANDVAAVMGDRVANMFCADAPYSERTHSGHNSSVVSNERALDYSKRARTKSKRACAKKMADGIIQWAQLEYVSWSSAEIFMVCDLFAPHVNGWWASITDSILHHDWESAFTKRLQLYTFAPLSWVELGSRIRLSGDGPSNWTCWLIVGRPKKHKFSRWGTLPGAYVYPGESQSNRPERITGGKSLHGMMQLLRDYSREGELVVDPVLGGGTTALAALKTGRRCIGIEQDRGRAELCAELVRAEALGTTRAAMRSGQVALFETKEETC